MTVFAKFTATTLLIVGSTLSAAAQEVTLRLHQFLPQTSVIPANVLQPWGDAIEEQSGGRMLVEHYASMTLGGTPPELFDQAKDGVVDIIWTVLGYTPGRFPKSEAFELPFLIADAESTSVAFQRYVEANAMDEFDGVKLLAVHTHGPGLFHTKTPINSLEDLEGMKVRGGSRIINEMLVALGAEPIGMPVPAVPESLSTGVIQGATIPWEVTSALRSSELVSNHTSFSGDRGLYSQTFAVVMNQWTYDSLPEDLKTIIDQNSGEALARLAGQAMDQGDINGRKIAEDLGNTIIVLDDEETARWKETAQAVIARWVEETPHGQVLYNSAVRLVEDSVSE